MSKTTGAVFGLYSDDANFKKEIIEALFESYEENPENYGLRKYGTVRGVQDVEWLMLLITGISVTADMTDIVDFITGKIIVAWEKHCKNKKKSETVQKKSENSITVKKSGAINEIRIKVFPEGVTVDVKYSGEGEVVLRFNDMGELI